MTDMQISNSHLNPKLLSYLFLNDVCYFRVVKIWKKLFELDVAKTFSDKFISSLLQVLFNFSRIIYVQK